MLLRLRSTHTKRAVKPADPKKPRKSTKSKKKAVTIAATKNASLKMKKQIIENTDLLVAQPAPIQPVALEKCFGGVDFPTKFVAATNSPIEKQFHKSDSQIATSITNLPFKKRFAGVDFWEMFDDQEFATKAEGITASKIPWSFTPVKSLPFKKRFISLALLGIATQKRPRCADSPQITSEEEAIAKKPRLDAGAMFGSSSCEENKENIPSPQVNPDNGTEKKSRRTLMFKSSRAMRTFSLAGGNTLSKWNKLNALNNLGEAELNSTFRQQIYNCHLCKWSIQSDDNLNEWCQFYKLALTFSLTILALSL